MMDSCIEMRQEESGRYTLVINGVRMTGLQREDCDILLRRWEREQVKRGARERRRCSE